MMIAAYAPPHNFHELIQAYLLTHNGGLPPKQYFENQVKNLLSTDRYLSTNSARRAIFCALKYLGVQKGDEVILPAFTADIVPKVVQQSGAIMKFADSNITDYNIDVESVLHLISKRTKGIVAVHTFGAPCDMKPLRDICEDHDLFLLEDAANAFGAEYHGRMAGTLGDVGIFSYGIGKSLSMGMGGGIVFTDDTSYNNFQKQYPVKHNHSELKIFIKIAGGCILSNPFIYKYFGHIVKDRIIAEQYKHFLEELKDERDIPDLSYCIGIIGLEKKRWLKRYENARFYNNFFTKIPTIHTPDIHQNSIPVFIRYFVRAESKDKCDDICQRMEKNGVEPLVPNNGYPVSTQFLSKADHSQIPNSIHLSHCLLGLPIYPAIPLPLLEKIFYD